MPGWYEKTRAWRKAGRLEVVGITQEQHPDRCRLFARWKGLEGPILQDPFNMTGTRVVPRLTLLDEHGVVRSLRPDLATVKAFLDEDHPAPKDPPPAPPGPRQRLVEAVLAKEDSPEAAWYGALSDLLWNTGNGDEAMAVLEAHARERPEDAAVQWRLGVAYRMRHDSGERHDGDFQRALDQWRRGLDLDPGHYIYRRRIQQYGPRLDKPYPFYPWVDEARRDLEARGEEVPPLTAPLSGAERAGAEAPEAAATPHEEPDARGALPNLPGLLQTESSVAWSTPHKDERATAARVHLALRPSGHRVLVWDHEAGPATLWLDLPKGWRTDRRRLDQPLRGDAPADEEVAFDFEVAFPDGKPQAGTIRGYVLYYACLDGSGMCRYIRQDVRVEVPAGP